MPEADWVAREIVERASAVVVSVDYRLAVDPICYPVPHDDVVAAVRGIRDRADAFNTKPGLISIGGASAGANLMAGAALRLRDEDQWLPANLILAYPLLHRALPPAPRELVDVMNEHPEAIRFSPDLVRLLNETYVGGPVHGADAYAFPADAALPGLGPTLILNAEYDDLRVSGQAFAAALAGAGVDVAQVMARGVPHGFLNEPPATASVDRTLALIAEVVARVNRPSNVSG